MFCKLLSDPDVLFLQKNENLFFECNSSGSFFSIRRRKKRILFVDKSLPEIYIYSERTSLPDICISGLRKEGFFMDSARLENYADLIVNTGINPDPGQDVVITAGFDQLDFVRMVTEKCYARKVGKVWFNWVDMPIEKLHYLYQSEDRLSSFENWEVEKLRWQSEKLPARLWLDSDDPDGMDGIDPEKRARAQMKRFPVIKPFRDAMENRHQWCIAGVPGKAWAQKVFPGIPVDEAVEKLWDAILTASRANGDASSWYSSARLL